MKELEQRHFLKLESVQREYSTLKTQVEMGTMREPPSMSQTKDSLLIEELQGTVAALQRDLESQKEESQKQGLKNKALLADVQRSTDSSLLVEELQTTIATLKRELTVQKENAQKQAQNHKTLLADAQQKALKQQSLLAGAQRDSKIPIPISSHDSKHLTLTIQKKDGEIEKLANSFQKTKKRILELETELVNQKAEFKSNVDALCTDHAKRLGEKDLQLSNMEFKFKLLEARQVNLAEVDQLKAKLDDTLNENSSLKFKVELAEQAQRAFHESTMEIMKSSQQQTSKIAFEHSRYSIEMLRSELRQELQVQHANLIESYKSRISELETQLMKETPDHNEPKSSEARLLNEKYLDSKDELEQLKMVHSRCEERFKRTREGLPPSLAELDRLCSRIQELETMNRSRGRSLSHQENHPPPIDFEKEALAKQVSQKDAQIRSFQRDLSELVYGINLLKSRVKGV